MDINELQSYSLDDAVKFNDSLNPRLWGSNEHLLPEVKEKLLAIAEDFREFLGVSNFELKDITVSGSNAAYTYTPHSDIDLHLVVDLPKADVSDVYRELFDAKKYQYNDQHDYKIGPYDVELYVQDARQPHVSQGIYSVLNDKWIKVPSRRRPNIDDISVKSKFEDLGHRIEQAIASGNKAKMDAVSDKIKNMRKAGLQTTGEFGAENLAFKILRTQGLLDQLRAARFQVKDQELSLQERKRRKRSKFRYGKFGGLWFPGFGAYGSGEESSGDTGGGESQTRINENPQVSDLGKTLNLFKDSCVEFLDINNPPTLKLKRDPEWTKRNGTFGRFDPDTNSIYVSTHGRHVLDILRTMAHELTHAKQNEEVNGMPVDAGETGSPYEDDANAMAGRIMRHWVDNHPEYFKDVQLEDYDPDHPPGPEFKPTMPAGTVRVDVSDVYDWYKLGQHISNLKGLGHHDFGKGPPSTIVSFGSEPEEHKYIKDLEKTGLTTTDIDPVDRNQPPDMPRQKTDPTYNVNEADGKKSAIYATDVYGMTAYHSKCLEPGCDWQSRRYDRIKQAQDAAQKHAQKHFKQGAAKGSLNELAPSPRFGGDDDDDKYIPPDFGKPFKANYLGQNKFQVFCRRPQDPNNVITLNAEVQKYGLEWDDENVRADGTSHWFLDSPGAVYLSWKYGEIPLPKAIDQARNPGHIHDLVTDYLTYAHGFEIQKVAKYFGFTPDGEMNENMKGGSLKEFAPPGSDGGGENERSRRLRKLLEIAIKVAKEKNVDELGMIHAMNMIAGDDFFNTAVEGLLPDITDQEYMFVLQTAYKTVKQGLTEAFDQPYKLRWEKGDYGDVDAYAKMADGNYLSIMFNKGYSQGSKEEAWSVEFFRNNSQEITGEGDKFRIFATVLDAIKKFIRNPKYKPNRIIFSASKEVEPGQKIQSRANLYDTLVQRYARALGFKAFRADAGNKVHYELSRIKPVAEATGYIPVNDKEARDPRYSMAITQDIKPGEVQRQAAKMGWKTDAAGRPPLLMQQLEQQLKIIKEGLDDLQEIKMTPKNLAKEAEKIGALAGMEFEMIVPGTGEDNDYPDLEPDYDQDERIRRFSDIAEFFNDGEYNSRRDVENFTDEVWQDYMDSDWLSEKKQEEWGEVAEDSVRDLVSRNYEDDFREQAEKEVLANAPEFGVNAEEIRAAVEERLNELFLAKVDEILADMGKEYDEAFEEWQDNEWDEIWNNDDMFTDWLDSEGIRTMAQLQSAYTINWPYYNETSQGGEVSIEEIAKDFENAIGRNVKYSQSYHGAKRDNSSYIVEPDSSISAENSGEGGLEFVSPPLPIDQLLLDLNKVKRWADRVGAYTNDSTGLHINVSVPGWDGDLNKLDYVKLAILLGDEYVLDEFGRAGNTYTKSALKIIKSRIQQRPEDAAALLQKMKQHLNTAAAKSIHTGVTNKYTSINVKDGYIEFRSPGGDWLADENYDKIENALLRFVVALDAAVDETKYREEYAKKLYKLLAPSNDSSDTLQYFTKFSSGELPRSALSSFVRQAQLQRKLKKGPTGVKYWWSVENPPVSHASIEVVASTKEEAISIATGPDGYPGWANTPQSIVAKPLRPYDQSPVRATAGEPQPAGSVGGEQSSDANYEIVDRRTNRPVFRFIANTDQEATRKYEDWLNALNLPQDTEDFGFRATAR